MDRFDKKSHAKKHGFFTILLVKVRIVINHL